MEKNEGVSKDGKEGKRKRKRESKKRGVEENTGVTKKMGKLVRG